MPPDLPTPPIYSKTNPADTPILTLALTSSTLPLSKVEDLADTRLAPEDFAVARRRTGEHQRRAEAGGADPGESDGAGVLWDESRGCARRRLWRPTSNQAKGSFDGPRQAYTIGANDQMLSSEDYRRW